MRLHVRGRTQRRSPSLRAQRREEGEARNAEWRKMSVADQVSSLIGRRGKSEKQLARLQGD